MTRTSDAERARAYRQRVALGLKLPEDEESPDVWDGQSFYSSPVRAIRHVAVCVWCSRSVTPSEPEEWRKAVRTLICKWCGGHLLVEEMDMSEHTERGDLVA